MCPVPLEPLNSTEVEVHVRCVPKDILRIQRMHLSVLPAPLGMKLRKTAARAALRAHQVDSKQTPEEGIASLVPQDSLQTPIVHNHAFLVVVVLRH